MVICSPVFPEYTNVEYPRTRSSVLAREPVLLYIHLKRGMGRVGSNGRNMNIL